MIKQQIARLGQGPGHQQHGIGHCRYRSLQFYEKHTVIWPHKRHVLRNTSYNIVWSKIIENYNILNSQKTAHNHSLGAAACVSCEYFGQRHHDIHIFCCIFLFQSYYQILMGSSRLLSHILHGCSTGTGAIVWLPRCQWSNREEGDYSGITTSMYGKVGTMCI